VQFKTYTSSRSNPLAFLREIFNLYRIRGSDIPGQVAGTIAHMHNCEGRILDATGLRLEGLKTLVIGPGQTAREMVYLALRNDVIGIDLDAIPQGFDPIAYLHMLQRNGPMRILKTLGRKVLGLDAKFNRELYKQLHLQKAPRNDVVQMDATRMSFPDGSFDFIYSFSVFEHLPDPARAIAEAARVLKPGGACYISVHFFSSENGGHDIRIFSGDRAGIPHWAHLRPEHESSTQPNAYLNKVRLADWIKMFEERMPGVSFMFDRHEPSTEALLRNDLEAIRARGELADYTDDELLCVNLVAIWKK
jgi:SAM-dependent methyltransferase